MNRKSLFMLTVLAVALVVAWYWIGQTQRSPEVAQMPAWLPELQAVQVSAIDVQRAGQPKVRLERREQGWVVPDKADYPADQAAVAALLNALVEARRVEPRTANPELYGRLGLAEQGESEQQAVRLTLEQTEQPPLALLIGKPGQHDGQLVRQVGDPQSWLISRRIELPATELQWLDRRITAVPFSAVRELDLQHATGERLTLLRDTPQDASLQPAENIPWQDGCLFYTPGGRIRMPSAVPRHACLAGFGNKPLCAEPSKPVRVTIKQRIEGSGNG